MLDGKLSIVEDQVAISVQELIEKLNNIDEDVLFIGDGIKAYSEKIAENIQVKYKFAPVSIREIQASSLVQSAYDYIEEGKITTSAGFVLDYLRKSQAERELEERKKLAN
jgi:tRNA threonylcarbamoyladenosine biosynthesis protein TsaB